MTAIISQNQGKACVTQRYAALVFENNPHAIDRFSAVGRCGCSIHLLMLCFKGYSSLYFCADRRTTQGEVFGIFHLFVEETKGVSPYRASLVRLR
ncbi:MAG: hypothetical protein R2822_25790 [Spirosomataceae bacterium]